MPPIETLFATEIYRAELAEAERLNGDAEAACRSLAVDDAAGVAWCRKNNYPGYTSYASLADLPWRFPVFKQLAKAFDRHVLEFARVLEFDLRRGKPQLDSLWVNVLPPGGAHSGHIHPHSVISGTYYVAVPDGASALRFEDPRLGLMMAAPPRKAKANRERQPFVYVAPEAGTILLWESWLRHEVPPSQAREERISISFNYRWA